MLPYNFFCMHLFNVRKTNYLYLIDYSCLIICFTTEEHRGMDRGT